MAEKLAGNPRLKGPPGPQGPPGKDAKLDYDKLAGEVVKRLPPVRIQIGQRVIEARLGEKISLPPIRMEIQHPNGQVRFQEKPLGGIIAIRLVPVRSQ